MSLCLRFSQLLGNLSQIHFPRVINDNVNGISIWIAPLILQIIYISIICTKRLSVSLLLRKNVFHFYPVCLLSLLNRKFHSRIHEHLHSRLPSRLECVKDSSILFLKELFEKYFFIYLLYLPRRQVTWNLHKLNSPRTKKNHVVKNWFHKL